ncbi:MAG: uroporphyrinogen-III synthase [Alphaproteobacteria bacterium]|jgi:uroporphyrinogen-III synthase|nr:uroporphyrinogen-III synthase [Alphaproteobacteria bacterium]
MARWLITRPAAEAEALAESLAARGHEGVIAPVLDIRFDSGASVDLAGCQAVLLTSANGARALAALTAERAVPVLAVGGATAATARAAGFENVKAAAGDAAALARLAQEALDPAAGALFHAAGRDMAGDLAGALRQSGFAVQQKPLYTAEAVTALPQSAQSALRDGRLAGVLFFSPRTAAVFGTLVRQTGLIGRLGGLYALCLSPAVAGRLRQEDWRGVRVADHPEQAALLRLLDPLTPGRGTF